jgi:hypothetical protein
MRAILLLVGFVACSGREDVVRAPLSATPAPAVTTFTGSTPTKAETEVPAEPRPVVRSLEGSTWAWCDTLPAYAYFAFLPGGKLSEGDHLTGSQCEWSQDGVHVRFRCGSLDVKAQIGVDGRMYGQWRNVGVPQAYSACFQPVRVD